MMAKRNNNNNGCPVIIPNTSCANGNSSSSPDSTKEWPSFSVEAPSASDSPCFNIIFSNASMVVIHKPIDVAMDEPVVVSPSTAAVSSRGERPSTLAYSPLTIPPSTPSLDHDTDNAATALKREKETHEQNSPPLSERIPTAPPYTRIAPPEGSSDNVNLNNNFNRQGDNPQNIRRPTVSSWAYAYMKSNGIFNPQIDTLEKQGQARKQLKFVHQLDYATSGVLCLAFNKSTAADIAHCFEMRTSRKWYIALLAGGDLPILHTDAVKMAMERRHPENMGDVVHHTGRDMDDDNDKMDDFALPWIPTSSFCHSMSSDFVEQAEADTISARPTTSSIDVSCVVKGHENHGAWLASKSKRASLRNAFHLLFSPEKNRESAAAYTTPPSDVGMSPPDGPMQTSLAAPSAEVEPVRPRIYRYVEAPASGEAIALCPDCRRQDSLHELFSTVDAGGSSSSDVQAETPTVPCSLCAMDACFAHHTLIDVTLPIGRDETDAAGFRMSIHGADNREASTSVLVLSRGYVDNPSCSVPGSGSTTPRKTLVTKVLLMPRTGRRHQLRLHTWALGHPILGDVCYAAVPHPLPCSAVLSHQAAEAGCWPRMCLHAWRLVLPLRLLSEGAALAARAKDRARYRDAMASQEEDALNHHLVGVLPRHDELYEPLKRNPKRMRRERLGLEDPEANAIAQNEWTDFLTADPFIVHH